MMDAEFNRQALKRLGHQHLLGPRRIAWRVPRLPPGPCLEQTRCRRAWRSTAEAGVDGIERRHGTNGFGRISGGEHGALLTGRG